MHKKSQKYLMQLVRSVLVEIDNQLGRGYRSSISKFGGDGADDEDEEFYTKGYKGVSRLGPSGGCQSGGETRHNGYGQYDRCSSVHKVESPGGRQDAGYSIGCKLLRLGAIVIPSQNTIAPAPKTHNLGSPPETQANPTPATSDKP
jgi:hypothetical protein